MKQLVVLCSNVGVELLGQLTRQLGEGDQARYVGQILDPTRAQGRLVVGITLVAFGPTKREGLVALGAIVVGIFLARFAKVRPEGTQLAPKP